MILPQELLSEIELVSSFRHPDLVPEPCVDDFFVRFFCGPHEDFLNKIRVQIDDVFCT